MKKITLLFAVLLAFCIRLNSQVTYTGKPMYKMDIKRGGVFIGSMKLELFPNIAYHHTRNFDSLVSVHYFDTTAFHRVVPGFMIQGGDPNSRHGNPNTWGNGQPNQPTVNAEFTAAKHVRGTLSAARDSDTNSATSQFFICVANYPSLNGNYSAYGRVTGGMNIADTIVNAPRNSNDRPNVKHEMFISYIGSNDTVPTKPNLNSPANNTVNVSFTAQLLLKWGAKSDGIIYTLQVSEDTNFVTLLKTVETGNNSYYLNPNLLRMSQKVFWRVKVNNGGHTSDWSNTFKFYTATDAVGIKENASAPAVSVYPNPSQDIFTFSHLPKGSSLEIFDFNGKQLLFKSHIPETFTLDLSAKERGLYFYKISSGGKETGSGKLVLK